MPPSLRSLGAGGRGSASQTSMRTRVVARQPQAQGRLVVVARHGLHGVGYELGDQEFGVSGQAVQSPLPQQVPGVEPGAGHGGRQGAEFEVTA